MTAMAEKGEKAQVVFMDPPYDKDLYRPVFERLAKSNIIDDNTIEMRVWERGSGETMACGTGACATAVAYLLKNNINCNENPVSTSSFGVNTNLTPVSSKKKILLSILSNDVVNAKVNN